MRQSIINPEHVHVDVQRFKYLSKNIRDRIYRLCPPAGRDRPAYVIYAGSPENMDHKKIPPVISYQGASSALFLPRSPVTLASRGEINHLDAGSVYFISEDRSAKIRTKMIYAAAACILLALSAGLYSMFGQSGIPAEYRNLAFRLPAEWNERLYASIDGAKESDHEKALNAWVESLLGAAIDNETNYFRFEEYIPFCERVINDERFTPRIRTDAFEHLCEAAFSQKKLEILLPYRNHPEPFIRASCEQILKLKRDRYKEAGIDLEG